MINVVVVNGMPRSGKDTFVGFCLDSLKEFGFAFSTVDCIKEIATQCGWNGEKTPKDRKFLSDLKDLLTEWNDVPYQSIRREIAKICLIAEQYNISHDKFTVFIHCREPEEIQRFVDEYNAITVLLRRPDVENNEQSNHADMKVFEYSYDYEIINDEGLDELRDAAKAFLHCF